MHLTTVRWYAVETKALGLGQSNVIDTTQTVTLATVKKWFDKLSHCDLCFPVSFYLLAKRRIIKPFLHWNCSVNDLTPVLCVVFQASSLCCARKCVCTANGRWKIIRNIPHTFDRCIQHISTHCIRGRIQVWWYLVVASIWIRAHRFGHCRIVECCCMCVGIVSDRIRLR